jgi:hypothetical protein
MHISIGDLCDFDLVLNGQVSKEVLDQFVYVHSMDAYYYESKNNLKPFDTVYLHFKKKRISRIQLLSNIHLQNIRSGDDYEPEHILKIISDKYYNLGTPKIIKYINPLEYRIEWILVKWIYENIEIKYRYLPYSNFNINREKWDNAIYTKIPCELTLAMLY